jgi:hypothetical protein
MGLVVRSVRYGAAVTTDDQKPLANWSPSPWGRRIFTLGQVANSSHNGQ